MTSPLQYPGERETEASNAARGQRDPSCARERRTDASTDTDRGVPPTLLAARLAGKRYGARAVLEQIAFEIRRGEIVSLVGPTGCGKSTLLRVLAGLDRAFEGDVRLDAGRSMDPRRASA